METKSTNVYSGIGTDQMPVSGLVQQPLLIEFSERFSDELRRQTNLVSQIQDMLHKIFDKRTPEKENDGTSIDLPDISSKLKYSQSKLESNNMMLERISNHLSEII